MTVAALLLAQAATYNLPADPALDRPLALEARIEPLPDLLKRIGREVGRPLTVERGMESLKATVFSAPRPARLTLAGLASVFDAEWTAARGGGYRLAMTIPARNRLERHLAAVREARLGFARLQVDRMKLAAEIPWEGLNDALAGAEKAMARFTSPDQPGALAAHERTVALRTNRDAYLTGRLLRQLDEKATAAFWEGRAFYASSAARKGAYGLPPDASLYTFTAEEGYARRPRAAGGEIPVLRLFVRYEPEIGVVNQVLLFDGGGRRTLPSAPNSTSFGAKSAYRAALEAWGADSPAAAEVLDRPVVDALPAPSPWAGPFVTDSEHLHALHRATGVPVVAEASRVKSRAAALTPTGPTLRTAIAAWNSRGWTRVQDGALLYRPGDVPSERASEPPEAPLRRYEALRSPTLDDHADLVAALPPPVARQLWRRVAKRRLERFSSMLPPLRIWARLSPAERRSLLAGTPLRLAEMDADAREAARQAVLEGVFDGGSPTGAMLALFDAPWEPERFRDLALFVATEGVDVPNHDAGLPMGTPRGSERQPLAAAPGARFEIGAAPGEGMAFVVAR